MILFIKKKGTIFIFYLLNFSVLSIGKIYIFKLFRYQINFKIMDQYFNIYN